MTTPQHTLYRFYSETGQLLYVGRTINPPQRFADHARTKTWWTEVRGITTQTYPDADTLAAAERRAIDIEKPLYNLVRPKLRSNTELATPAPTLRNIVWICDHCTTPIANGDGYLHVNLNDVRRAERTERELGANPTLDDLIADHPDDVPWLAHHTRCDPQPESLDYWYDVSRLRTHADLLARTAHLNGKRWIDFTDWFDLIARIAAVEA